MRTVLGLARRVYFRIHHTIGLWLSALLLLSALTGTVLLFRGSLKEPTPTVEPVASPVSLETIVARAVKSGDGSPATDLSLPLEPTDPYRVYLDDDAETIVFLDGHANIVASRTTAGGLTRILFQLHTGELLGTPGLILTLLTGLGLCTLVGSGLAMLLSRRRR